MALRTVFSGELAVDYHQFYVQSLEVWWDDVRPDPQAAFAGQHNGLCGAAAPGFLFLTTGLNVGRVGFTVDLHDKPPPVDRQWEEVVETSFTPAAGEVELVEWGGQPYWLLPLMPASPATACATAPAEWIRRTRRASGCARSLNWTATCCSSG